MVSDVVTSFCIQVPGTWGRGFSLRGHPRLGGPKGAVVLTFLAKYDHLLM